MSFVPVVGPSGEIVYCMQTGTNGALQPPVNPAISSIRFEDVQRSFVGAQNQQLVQANASGGFVMQHLQNGLLSIPNALPNTGNLIRPFEQISPLGKPIENDQGISGKLQLGTQQTNLSSSPKIPSSLNFGVLPDARNLPAFSPIENNGFHKQHTQTIVSSQDLSKLGPVEKAIFKQALITQNKKLFENNKNSINKNPGKVQGQSDMRFRNTKHLPEMFMQQNVQDASFNEANPLHGTKDPTSVSVASDQCHLIKSVGIQQTESKLIAKNPFVPVTRYHPYQNKSANSHLQKESHELKDLYTLTYQNKSAAERNFATNASISSCLAASVHSVSVSNMKVVTKTISSSAIKLDNALCQIGGNEVQSRSSQNLLKGSNDSLPCLDLSSTEKQVCAEGENNAQAAVQQQIRGKQEENQSPDAVGSETLSNNDKDSDEGDETKPPKLSGSPISEREVHLPDPLPSYITKIDRPPGRILKESLHCTTCDVYVNSENQMKQHINSLRHKNTLQGIPTPPKPNREEKPKPRAEQYRCSVCKVTLNSDIQLSQHLSSQRHKNMLEGKPPKPRWSPYDRTQQAILQTMPGIRLPFKTLSSQALLPSPHSASPIVSTSMSAAIPGLSALSVLPAPYLPTQTTVPGSTHLKQAPLLFGEGGLVQGHDVVYVGTPQLTSLPQATAFPSIFPGLPGVLANQQQLQLQPLVAAPQASIDWMTANGLRLST